MTWSAAPSASPSRSPSVEPASPLSAIRGVEWGLGAIAGEGAGMFEAGVTADVGRLAAGALLTIGGANEHLGLGFHLAAGPRLRLADGVRLDALVDAGLVFFGEDGEHSVVVSSHKTSGSDETRPAIGARLGVTFASASSGWFLSLGAAIRHVSPDVVSYTVTDCSFIGFCATSTRTARYGGTIAGGYLTFGRSTARGR